MGCRKTAMKKLSDKTVLLLSIFIGIILYYQYKEKLPVSKVLSSQNSITAISTSSAILYPVTKVVDGDTLKIRMDGKEETVRLLGADTPEFDTAKSQTQCYAQKAFEETKSLVQGLPVSLEVDPTQGERDTYGRLLAYVHLQDGVNVSEYLIRNGFAREYTFMNNPHRYQTQFREREKQAQEEKRGLWSEGGCL
jgi:endonuclease YncB( thermonuclease family)